MSIPKELKHEEVGALLIAIGEYMMHHHVAAEVVLDWGTYSDPVGAMATWWAGCKICCQSWPKHMPKRSSS